MRRRSALVVALCAVGFAGSAPPAAGDHPQPAPADPLNDGLLGGTPDLSETSGFPNADTGAATCPAQTVMTGVTGRTRTAGGNTTVATITAQCTGSGGPVIGSTLGRPDPLDGSGSSSCPAGQVAVGIQGRESDSLDQLILRCQAADFTGPVTPTASSFGGSGGRADGPYDCSQGQALTGLFGELEINFPLRGGVNYVKIGSCTPPVVGRTVEVQETSGQVLIAIPADAAGGLRFVPLERGREIPIGSFIDTRRGAVELTTARNARGDTQSGSFSGGLFQVRQSRRRSARGLTDLVLKGSSFRGCGRSGFSRVAEAAAHRKRTIRRLRGNTSFFGAGRFRTRGRYSAATVRGTVWSVTDRCDGTLTKVREGSVVVRDFRRRRNVTVRAGKRTRGGGRGSYLARAR